MSNLRLIAECVAMIHLVGQRESPTRSLRLIPDIDVYLDELSDEEFKRVHRVSRSLFYRIAEKIKTKTIYLSATLRFLAGSRMLDISHMYGLSESYIYRKFHDTIALIAHHFKITQQENFESPVFLKENAYNFRLKSSRGVLQGCVGAVDGLVIHIEKPRVEDPLAFFTTRYKKFGVNVQAVCDAKRKFCFLSVKYGAATHDSKALELSRFSEDVAKDLPPQYWIAGDAAYRASHFAEIVTPFTAGCSRKENDFNFFLSQLRINIECAFGMLMRRFGIFWRPLRCSIDRVATIVSATMAIHNLIIDDGDMESLNAITEATKTVTGCNPPSLPVPCGMDSFDKENVPRAPMVLSKRIPEYALPDDRSLTRTALLAAVTAAGCERPRRGADWVRARRNVLGGKRKRK